MKKSQIVSILEKKGYKVTGSESKRLIEDFDKSNTANLLWAYLSTHPSFRILFNAIIKEGGTINYNEVLRRIPDMLKSSNTSFVYEAHCKKCNQILDRPHILDIINQGFPNKEIFCGACKTKNSLNQTAYKPNYSPEMSDLIKTISKGCDKEVFSCTYSYWCYNCNEESKPVKKCPNCKKPIFISTGFYPILDENFQKLISNQQGYWLEWYIWRLLRNEYDCELGLKLRKNESEIQCDLIILFNNKILILECKDTSDDSFISKIFLIKKISDFFFLISTNKLKLTTEKTLNSFLHNKNRIVYSNEIENISELVRNSMNKVNIPDCK